MSAFDRYLIASASFVVRHWLTIMNVLLFLFISPIVLYPLFMASGDGSLRWIAGLILALYHPTCHQIPDRCLFLFGYQMAVCSRCFAIYAAFLAGGLLFYVLRGRLKPVHFAYFILACIPMGVDGTAQLFGIPLPRAIGPGFELIWMPLSTNLTRVVTGAIFGLGSALFVLPYIEHVIASEDEYRKEASAAQVKPQP